MKTAALMFALILLLGLSDFTGGYTYLFLEMVLGSGIATGAAMLLIIIVGFWAKTLES